MFCWKCGAANDNASAKCAKCGEALRTGAARPPGARSGGSDPGEEALSSVIPYRNVCALIAYYLGVFSLIPCVGIFLGIAAFVLGIVGLRHAARHPEAKGKVHAWVGVIVGGLFGFGYLALSVAVIVSS